MILAEIAQRVEVSPSLPLFVQEDAAPPASLRLMQAFDAVNSRYGPGSLRVASAPSSAWKQRQERLSPHYATDWDDIITIRH